MTAITRKQLVSTRQLCVMAMLCAMVAVLRMPGIAIQTGILKITFGFIPVALTAMLYGFWPAVVVGTLGDFLSCMISGAGNWIFTLTLVEGVSSGLYGLFLAKDGCMAAWLQKNDKWGMLAPILIVQLIIDLVCHLVLNTLCLMAWGYFAGQSLSLALSTRVIKNAVLYPIEVALLVALARVPDVLKRAKLV